MIYLLDLNFTLVANSHRKAKPFSVQIEGEEYRDDLVKRLRGERVLMLTARPDRYALETLDSIERKTGGWRPERAFFNSMDKPPPEAKRLMLDHYVLPDYPAPFLAIESNPATRAMYASKGIEAVTYKQFMQRPAPGSPHTADPS